MTKNYFLAFDYWVNGTDIDKYFAGIVETDLVNETVHETAKRYLKHTKDYVPNLIYTIKIVAFNNIN